jgi:hypothetical protein
VELTPPVGIAPVAAGRASARGRCLHLGPKAAARARQRPAGHELPPPVPGKVNVTAFTHGWCMGANLVTERARRAAAELGGRVAYREVDTAERAAAARWGQSDALFIDGVAVRTGPPPSYARIHRAIEKRLARLPRAGS